MFSQLIYFIVAILIFTVEQPETGAPHHAVRSFALAFAVFLLFVLVCRSSLSTLARRLDDPGDPLSEVSLRYHRLQGRLSILALALLAVYVFVLDIKPCLLGFLPGLDGSLTLDGVVGLLIYHLHLAVVWYWSHPVHRRLHRTEMSRWTFIRGNIWFQLAFLIPWVLLSLLSDLLQLVPTPAFLASDGGEMVLSGALLALFLLFSPGLIVRLWRCEPLPSTPEREELERFCRERNFKVGGLMLWPLFGGEMLTAAIMGVLPRLRYILITRGLLRILDTNELRAVVSHEMGHVRRFHLIFYLLFFIAFSVTVYSMQDFLRLFLLKQIVLHEGLLSSGAFRVSALSFLYLAPTLLLMVLYFRYIFGFFMRNCERQADLYAMKLIGHPFSLISSLEKIAFYSGQIENLPSWHHFSIGQRTRFLRDCHEDPGLVPRHHLKLYGAAALFFVAVGAIGWAGFQFEGSRTAKAWRLDLASSVLEHEVGRDPKNAELYAAYGEILFERKQYGEAEAVMLKALGIAPDNYEILNNLAWLYATSPPPHLDREAALDLALRAVKLAPDKPHILDTLAESYYINGRYREALEAVEAALADNPENIDYYLGQERKFQDALEREKER